MFGTATVNVKSPIGELADLPGKPDSQVYFLDLDLITPEQRARLIEHISRKFNLPAAEVESGLDARGVATLAEDCVVTVYNPQKWFGPDDFEQATYPDLWDLSDDDDYDPYYDDYDEEDFL